MFDRDAMARWYAEQHLKSDPGTDAIHYVPENSPNREIRLIEVNHLIPEREPEPIDFGVDRGTPDFHRVVVLDVTPSQWDRILNGLSPLPDGWSLAGAQTFGQA